LYERRENCTWFQQLEIKRKRERKRERERERERERDDKKIRRSPAVGGKQNMSLK